jgi:hypothetical protein
MDSVGNHTVLFTEQSQNLNSFIMTQPVFINRKVTRESASSGNKNKVKNTKLEQAVIDASEDDKIVIPSAIKLIRYSTGNFRLGMEKTKEQFMAIPGTSYRWEPDIVGNTFKTGLQYISKERRDALALALGHKLDAEFYQEMTYVMDGSNPHGHHMDLTLPKNMVIYLAMLDSKLIAGTKMEKQNGTKPEADWYIENADAEAEYDSKNKDLFMEVMKVYAEMSIEKKANVAKVMGIAVRGLSPKVADNKLWAKLADTKDKLYIKTLTKFKDIAKWTDEKINIYAEIEDAIALNIIRKNAAQDFVYGDEVLGSTKEQVQSKMLDGTKGGLRASIQAKLSVK